ncbi:MAG TPA: helix-turn-helix transcriptional regulator [Candidatus Eisenbergiella intestinipullorum]|nr:helix-turn-helix transcriptional regulator [Candidatus Eisenbergiella intestinipullorum]
MNHADKSFEEPDSFSRVIAGRISAQLSRHNWSLRTLSDRSSVPYETIKKVANAKIKNPSLKNILKIAEAFGCSIDYLAGRQDAPIPPRQISGDPQTRISRESP